MSKMTENDPTGRGAHEPGAKLDAGKPLAGVLSDFSLALIAVAEVGTFGAKNIQEVDGSMCRKEKFDNMMLTGGTCLTSVMKR